MKKTVIMSMVTASGLLLLASGCCTMGKCEPKCADCTANCAKMELGTSEWKVVKLMSAEEKKLPVAERAFVGFNGKTSQIYGCSGDNRFFGGYKLPGGDKISFGAMGSTRMAGPNLKYEDCFFKAMEQVASYRINCRKLTFFNAKGDILMVFAPVVKKGEAVKK